MMSIANLKRRMEERITIISDPAHIQTKFIRPQRLIKTLSIIEKKFDDFENAQPLEEKIIKSVFKLEQQGFDGLTKRDWKNLAWSLSKKFPHYEEKLLFTAVGKRIINHLNQAGTDLIILIYFPLLYSYFAFEQNDVINQPNTWVQLRNILNKNKSNLFKTFTHPKKWMNTLIDYSEVLSTKATEKFVGDFLHNDAESSVAYQLESLRISANSWFWDDLIRSSIKSIKDMREDEYFQMIPRFLVLIEKNEIYKKDILASLLERYACTSKREKIHELLKHMALDQWGNPQYESSAGWNNVNFDTKKMVIQWFVKADLEAFFKLFNQNADIQRFDYWMRFIDQINFSQIFLGTNALNSKRDEHLKFRKVNRGRLKELAGSTTSTNNAFLLRIGNIYIVDFSETGNACYFYNCLPYKDYIGKIDIKGLRNQQICIDRQTRNGNWQPRFDNALARLGIFPKR